MAQLATACVLAGGNAFTGELEVVLWNAVLTGKTSANLVLELESDRGEWKRVWGTALERSNAVHVGLVDDGMVAMDEARLAVRMIVGGDQWQRGEHMARYVIDLKRDADGRLDGRFAGVYDGRSVQGKATGQVKPARKPVGGDWKPVQADEHPRVLFRRSDLPGLRERLNTPLGQAWLSRVKADRADPVNCGVAYQLTGDRMFAAAAGQAVEKFLHDADAFALATCGDTIVAAALAYDLCYDGWTEEFRERMRKRMLHDMPMLSEYLYCHSFANNHPCSNFYGRGYGGASIASLVFVGLKGPAPVRPAVLDEGARELGPPPMFEPGPGVPVVDFVAGNMPDRWLAGGPLPGMVSGDVLSSIGGYANARPVAGQRVKFSTMTGGRPRTSELTFEPLPAAAMTDAGVNLRGLGATGKESTVVLYTVLQVAEEVETGWVRADEGTRVWLAGEELADGVMYRLKPGRYPVVVTHQARDADKPVVVRLEAATGGMLQARADARALREDLWKRDMADWERTGEDQAMTRVIDRCYARMYRHWRMGIGDGGFQAETGPHYSELASWYPSNYAVMYRRVFGRDASGFADVTHLLPRRLMQTHVPDNGSMEALPVNSVTGMKQEWLAALFPIVPDAYRAHVLWAWNKVAGVTDDRQSLANLVRDKVGDGLPLANAFVNYPVDPVTGTTTIAPKHPADGMPLTWQASTFGFHLFRSGWQGADEFVGQVFLKAAPIKGWNHPNAGTFRLFGLGRHWVTGPNTRQGFRDQEPVVLLPDNNINEGANGRLIWSRHDPDGSGTLTIDYRDVYAPSGKRFFDVNLLSLPDEDQDATSALTGLRAVAFDYSGKSGVPCLMVIVDKIVGGNKRVWQWTLPPDAAGVVRLTRDGFVVDHGDATMKLTFIVPARPVLRVGADEVKLGDPAGGRHAFDGVLHRVQAMGETDFLAVATFQRGPAPEVRIEGEGLAARVAIGDQRVRFDGTRIVLGADASKP